MDAESFYNKVLVKCESSQELIEKLKNAPGILYGLDQIINIGRIERIVDDILRDQADKLNAESVDIDKIYETKKNEMLKNTKLEKQKDNYYDINIDVRETNDDNDDNDNNNNDNISDSDAESISKFEKFGDINNFEKDHSNHSNNLSHTDHSDHSGHQDHQHHRDHQQDHSEYSRHLDHYDKEHLKRQKQLILLKKKKREMRYIEKVKMLNYLDHLKLKDIKVKNLSIDSDYSEIKLEVAKHREQRKSEFAKKIFIMCTVKIVGILEHFSKKITFVNLSLDGWSDNVEYNLFEYDDVVDELLSKYFKAGKDENGIPSTIDIPPEIKFACILIMSGADRSLINQGGNSAFSSIGEMILKKKEDQLNPEFRTEELLQNMD